MQQQVNSSATTPDIMNQLLCIRGMSYRSSLCAVKTEYSQNPGCCRRMLQKTLSASDDNLTAPGRQKAYYAVAVHLHVRAIFIGCVLFL